MQIIFFLLLSLVIAQCPEPVAIDPNTIPFDIDPNLCPYRLLGSIELTEEAALLQQITACDPDNDSMIFGLNNEPNGMTIDPNTGWLSWTPAIGQRGVYYINVHATDIPPPENQPLTDNGTVIIRVNRKNRGPVLLPF